MRIQNNIAAMNAHRAMGSNNTATSKSLEKLSSGFRIPIIDVVKGNSKWILGCLGILLVISYFV